jgi:hypothetical protein
VWKTLLQIDEILAFYKAMPMSFLHQQPRHPLIHAQALGASHIRS